MAQGSHSSTPQLPENLSLEALPDARTAARLLAALEQLEKRGRLAPAQALQSSPASDEGAAALASLTTENRHLRQTQKQAVQRLDALLEQLPALFAATGLTESASQAEAKPSLESAA